MTNLITDFSGVILNQNAAATASLALTPGYVQEFKLPSDYARGGVRFPALTGFQFMADVSSLDAAVTWALDYKPFFGTWTRDVRLGITSNGLPATGSKVWYTCLFDAPVEVADLDYYDTFRLRITSAQASGWYTAPNPLDANTKLRLADETTAFTTGSGQDASLLFRVLGAVADSGTDIFGNQYRAAVVTNRIASVNPAASRDTFWLSDPKPSEFAVVSKFFDLGQVPRVVDRVLIDPLTPGVWCHVYWTNDGAPGTDDESWNDRLWNPIPRSFRLTSRDTYALPEPITARYIKLEFSHLQPRSYSPGPLQRPVRYQKHPSWVLSYFLLAAEANKTSEQFGVSSKRVVFDAYDLAFRYYEDDLTTSPNGPGFLTPEDEARTNSIIDDLTGLVDADVRNAISLSLRPYLSQPSTGRLALSLLGEVTLRSLAQSRYPVERLPSRTPVPVEVSSPDRDAVVFEQTFPVLWFYLTCRHRYREALAALPRDRAYFVGLREVAFTRERYTVASDTPMYVETLGDFVNTERNDFLGS